MTQHRNTIRIGCGAGQSDDRVPPAVELAKHGALDYLVFECLAERTIGRETLSKLHDPDKGYTPSLHERLRAVLPICHANNIRIVSNMGAANPVAGARAMRRGPRWQPRRCASAWKCKAGSFRITGLI